MSVTYNRRAILTTASAFLLGFTVALAVGTPTIVQAVTANAEHTVHGTVPRCTDAIADAGGICVGPIADSEVIEAIPACIYEDGSGQVACIWRADRDGNGLGHSFIQLDGEFYYLESTDPEGH